MNSILECASKIQDPKVLEGVQRVAEGLAASGAVSRTRLRKIVGKRALPLRKSRRAALDRLLAAPAKRGRPRKHSSLDDAEILALMEGHTRESCRWSARWKKQVRTMQGSIAAAHRNDPRLNEKISYRRLAHRLQTGKLNVCKPHRQTDKCDICSMWDNNAKGKITSCLQRWRRELQGFEPTIFEYSPWTETMPASDDLEDLREFSAWLKRNLECGEELCPEADWEQVEKALRRMDKHLLKVIEPIVEETQK